MQYKKIADSEIDCVRNSVRDSGRLLNYLEKTFAQIERCFDSTQSDWGVAVVKEPCRGTEMRMQTPYGEARCLARVISDPQPKVRVVVQKQERSQTDDLVWLDVWAFRVDKDGNVSEGDNYEAPFDIDGFYGGRVEIAIAHLCLSILYSVSKDVRP